MWLIEWAYKKETDPGNLPPFEDMVVAFQTVVPCPPGPQVCGIVDQKLAQFIPELAAAFPDSKFIWLTRDGRKVAASGYMRGWYGQSEERNPPHDWARWRLRGDKVGAVAPDVWEEMHPFERNAWYWAWANQGISAQLSMLDQARHRLVALERLTPEVLGEMQDWLGLEPGGLELVHANRGPAQQGMVLTDVRGMEFKEQAGEMMDTLYPGWRYGEET